MKLQASVTVARSVEDTWAYLGSVSNIAQWDRGVASTQVTNDTAPGVGLEFDTAAHPLGKSQDGAWGRMSYRIAETDPVRGCTVQLTSKDGNARYFKSAEWRFNVIAVPGGSKVICTAVCRLRLRYLFLAPILFAMKKAIRNDLEALKGRLEQQAASA